MSPLLLVMLLAAVLVIGAAVAFVRSVRRPATYEEEPLTPDSRTLLRPFDLITRDLESLATGGSESSLVAAEGLRAAADAKREAYRLALRRQKLVKDRGRAGVAADTYESEIGRIDAVLAKLTDAAREAQEEIHRLSAKEGAGESTDVAITDLRAVLLTARELRGESEGTVRA